MKWARWVSRHYWSLARSSQYRSERRKRLGMIWYIDRTIKKAAAKSQVGPHPMRFVPGHTQPWHVRLDSLLLGVSH